MNKLKSLVIVLLLMMLMCLSSLGELVDPDPKIAVITRGTTDDLGYNYQVNEAKVFVERALKLRNMVYYGGVSVEDCEAFMTDLITNQAYKAIIAVSPDHTKCSVAMATAYPMIKFLYLVPNHTDQVTLNSSFVEYSLDLPSYAFGVYAGIVSKTRKVGYVTPGPPLINNYPVNAFYQGILASGGSDIQLFYYTIDSWKNYDRAIGATDELVNLECDVIAQDLDDMTVSIEATAKRQLGLGTNGFDQSKIFGDKIVMYYVTNWTTPFMNLAKATMGLEQLIASFDVKDDDFFSFHFGGNASAIDYLAWDSIYSSAVATLKNKYAWYCDKSTLISLFRISGIIDSCLDPNLYYNIVDPFPGMTNLGPYRVPITYAELPPGLKLSITTISSVFIFGALILEIVVLVFRKRPSFRSASLFFCVLIITGGIVVYAGLIFWMRDPGYYICNITYWLVSEGFTLLIGSIIVKNIRIWLIFDMTESKKRIVTNMQLVPWITLLIVINSFLMGLITYRGGLDLVTIPSGVPYQYYEKCGLNSTGTVALYILLGYFALLLAVGVYVSWRIRLVDAPDFSESRQIANCLYIIAFAVVIYVTLIVSPQSYVDNTIILMVAGLFIATSPLVFIFVPKLMNLNSVFFEPSQISPIATSRYIASQPHFEDLMPLPKQYKVGQFVLTDFTEDTFSTCSYPQNQTQQYNYHHQPYNNYPQTLTPQQQQMNQHELNYHNFNQNFNNFFGSNSNGGSSSSGSSYDDDPPHIYSHYNVNQED